jgi:hypothetical protein
LNTVENLAHFADARIRQLNSVENVLGVNIGKPTARA